MSACGTPPQPPPPRAITVWRPLASWAGRGLLQTESFISDTGQLRLRWDTRNETAAGKGTFKVTLHSAVSGRPLVDPIERRGVQADTAYINEDPRAFFLLVEASNLDWTIAVDEGIPALTRAPLEH